MELLYQQEHVTCLNYEKSKRPIIEKFIFERGYHMDAHLMQEPAIVFVLEGIIHFSFGKFKNRTISQGKMMLLSGDTSLTMFVEEAATVVIFRLRNIKQLCDCFLLDILMCEKNENYQYELTSFDINERLNTFLQFLDVCVSDGLKCIYYLDIKVKELYFLLRAYSLKYDLFVLFYPILSHDLTFSDFVMKNHHKVKTVQELADLLHYSLSGFQKRFKKVFGVSPYQWMKEQRSKSIYHIINSSDKSLKEICDDYGFSSLSHFNDFCKANFGTTPGKIRKKKSALTDI